MTEPSDSAETIRQLRAELASVPQWRDIASAPRDGTKILLYGRIDGCEEREIVVGEWSKSCWCGPAWVGYEHRSDTEYVEPVAWMPLPAPPSEGDGK